MNSQTPSELVRDQGSEEVFHAVGYAVPIGKDGRRLWPTKLKRMLGQRMRSGELSVGEVQKTCQISSKTVHEWCRGYSRKTSRPQPKADQPAPVFAEIKVARDEPIAQGQPSQITFKRAGCEMLLPSSYPVESLVKLLRAFVLPP